LLGRHFLPLSLPLSPLGRYTFLFGLPLFSPFRLLLEEQFHHHPILCDHIHAVIVGDA
jgi:hypothetical protein